MARGGRGRHLGLALGLLLALLLAPPALRAKPTVRKERVVRPDSDLGERPAEDNQSFQYDHEAFLGKEDSKTFDQLTSEESKERLGKIVDRIDSDGDGFVTTEELKTWIKRVQKRYIYDNVAKVWKDYDRDKDDKISWEEYKQATYGYYLGNPTEFQDTSDHHTFKKMLPRDERRFKAADLDSDQTATREEFTAFLHPEEFEHMKEIVVLVRYPKSLDWEKTKSKAAPKPYPFLQSENVLQPKGNWTGTLKWNILECLCTQEMSQGRGAAITSSPQSQLFNTITEN